jgi:predicted AAA+ superfamily ATPase
MTEELLDIASAWSFWDRPVPGSVPRHVAWPASLHGSLALVVQGVRRCGKSTLLQQLVGHYGLDPARCLFLNLEDPRLTGGLDHRLLDAVVGSFEARHDDGEPLLIALDEVQLVDGWERWLRVRLDRPGRLRFAVTGSNASLLSGELGSALTGRHLTMTLYPFDLQERQLADPSVTLESWLHQGGFPEPAGLLDGDRLLRQYFVDIVERDIRERVGARSARPVRQVAHMVFESMGAELSLRRVAAAAGVATDTAGAYLDACEDAYLLFGVPFFAYSERKRAHRNRKYYPVDTGLRRVVVSRGGADRGKALECATHLVLRRHFGEVFYWRGAGEVDFVVRDGRRVIPVQVTWDAPQPRLERALDAFQEAFPHAEEAIIVTAERFPGLAAELAHRGPGVGAPG